MVRAKYRKGDYKKTDKLHVNIGGVGEKEKLKAV